VKLEKSLADLESKRLSVRNVEREKRNAKRYRKIRFIERQKLSRKLKQLQLLLNSARETEDVHKQKDIEKDIEKVSLDLLYIKHFPNSEKYISVLLPTTVESANDIQRIRFSIQKKLRNEAIVTEADEGLGRDDTNSLGDQDSIAVQDDFFLGEENQEEEGNVDLLSQPLHRSLGVDDESTSSEEDSGDDMGNNGVEASRRHDLQPIISQEAHNRKRSSPSTIRSKQVVRRKSMLKKKDASEKAATFRSPPSAPKREASQKLDTIKPKFKAQSKASVSAEAPNTPRRTRAEGGRKRRRKK